VSDALIEAMWERHRRLIREKSEQGEREALLQAPPPEVPARPAEPDEIPRGATTVTNTARKNGWDVQVTYARGPWITSAGLKLIVPGRIEEDEEDDDGDTDSAADKVPAIYDSIAVRARRGAQRVAATWIRKPWTKAGAAGGFTFAGAHIRPRHLNGGLHNSKTLNAYLKEAPDGNE
jgi:hypothetical protein